MNAERIRKQVSLNAPLERVWRAISESEQFGRWFGMAVAGPFVQGEWVSATIVPTEVDAEVAKHQEPYRGLPFELFIERIEPMRCFAFRWHPDAVEPGKYHREDPTTLVTFELEDRGADVLLTITESGFDRIPLERRAKAFADNSQGWELQTRLICRYLALYPNG